VVHHPYVLGIREEGQREPREPSGGVALQDKIGRVLIPMEDTIEVRGGKKVLSSRMSYPGYVLVEMDLDENTWHIVRNTPRVTGFVGSATSPSPLSDAEVDAIINRVHTPTDRPKPKVVFERNEQVRIVDGPFANFNGTVEEIDGDHSRLKVSVTIFGRSTPVELDFASVEKLVLQVFCLKHTPGGASPSPTSQDFLGKIHGEEDSDDD